METYPSDVIKNQVLEDDDVEKHLLKMQQFFMTDLGWSLSWQVDLLGNPTIWVGGKTVSVCAQVYVCVYSPI